MSWKLNAENRDTKDGDLTRAVQEIIDCNDDNRMDVLADKFGAEVIALLIESEGEEQINRVQGIAMLDGRPVMLGDCPCKGANCRAAWGAVWTAQDLNMSGHRGSLKTEPCGAMPASRFDAQSGMFLRPVPLGMNPDNWYRFERAHWGDADRVGLANFMNANVATTERGNSSGDWVVDE